MKDAYQQVTDHIIEALENGTAPWVKPWEALNGPGGPFPHNATSNHKYSGINAFYLWFRAAQRGFTSNGWMTYKQAKEKGGHVKKGAKSELVVYWKKLTVKDNSADAEEGATKEIPMVRYYNVFNVDEIEGGNIARAEIPEAPTTLDHIDQFIAATRAAIEHGGNRATYSKADDGIRLPHIGQFSTLSDYYAAALHELAHWTGHESRLDRKLKNRFAGESYAVEELIAEMTAAFLCAHLGIDGKLQHESYITSWLRVLKEDKRAIFKAAAEASKAADYIRQFSEPADIKEAA